MTKPLPTPPLARAIERDLFGALLGSLALTLVARFLLLAFELPPIMLVALLLLGAGCGAFTAHYGSRSLETFVVSFRDWNTRLRRVSLKVMLWMLVLSGVTGVATVLSASYDTRVAGTVVATAIAAGIFWPMSLLADRKRSQAAGLLGMVAVLAVYLLVIPPIWELDRQAEEMLITSLVIGLTVPFGMFFLSLTDVAATWIAARVGVGVYVTVLVLFLVATWQPGYWNSENWWATGWWCAAYGSLSFGSLCGLRRLTVDWRWLGVVTAFFAWVMILIAVWGQSEPAENWIIVITSVSVMFAHASLARLVPLKTGQQWLRLGTIAAVAAAAAFLDLEVVFQSQAGISLLGRISGSAAIIGSCGSLALIIFARLNRVAHDDSAKVELTEITRITLFCPRCHARLTATLGSDQCGRCKLKIVTAIEEAAES